MPRPKSHSRKDIIDQAMMQFWRHGFEATSMDDLVRATKVSRHGIYADFDGKMPLFLACLEAYQANIVTPAFGEVEAPGATLETVASYFEDQIICAEKIGLPGPGCLCANTMTELAPHDSNVASHIAHHNTRLQSGFANALTGSAAQLDRKLFLSKKTTMALMMVTFANGLWSMSRTTNDAQELRRAVRIFLSMVGEQIKACKKINPGMVR